MRKCEFFMGMSILVGLLINYYYSITSVSQFNLTELWKLFDKHLLILMMEINVPRFYILLFYQNYFFCRNRSNLTLKKVECLKFYFIWYSIQGVTYIGMQNNEIGYFRIVKLLFKHILILLEFSLNQINLLWSSIWFWKIYLSVNAFIY